MPRLTHLTALTYRIAVTGLITFSVYGLPVPRTMAASASEQSQLAVMLRQLTALEETAQSSAQIADEPGKRYSFDYLRLTGDIARIRQGLKDYLSPSRAQPRDPVELSGNYTTEGRQP